MEKNEKALLVGVNINNKNFEHSMEELENLTLACDIDIAGKVEQNLPSVNVSMYLGTGKVEEVKSLAKDLDVDVVIFNNELTPSQLRNLERNLDLPILDKTALILEIFSKRANTREAKLQVEVAKLKYMLPRLVGLHDSLGRQGGGSGLNNKGSGEKKLELDRRRIEDKLTELNKELEKLTVNRETQRKQRKKSEMPTVALVGYTNAGKSTLMNKIIEEYKSDDAKKVFEKDMLFATLDTTVRDIEIENNRKFLLADTVGFISELPHTLIKAFRSTLLEVRDADLLLHVVDYSDENYKQHIEVTNETLKEVGADNVNMIYVFNKCDLKFEELPIVGDKEIYISAKNKIGLKELINMISKEIYLNYIDCKFLIPYSDGAVVTYLNDNGTVLNTEYDETGTILTVSLKESDYNKYKKYEMK